MTNLPIAYTLGRTALEARREGCFRSSCVTRLNGSTYPMGTAFDSSRKGTREFLAGMLEL